MIVPADRIFPIKKRSRKEKAKEILRNADKEIVSNERANNNNRKDTNMKSNAKKTEQQAPLTPYAIIQCAKIDGDDEHVEPVAFVDVRTARSPEQAVKQAKRSPLSVNEDIRLDAASVYVAVPYDTDDEFIADLISTEATEHGMTLVQFLIEFQKRDAREEKARMAKRMRSKFRKERKRLKAAPAPTETAETETDARETDKPEVEAAPAPAAGDKRPRVKVPAPAPKAKAGQPKLKSPAKDAAPKAKVAAPAKTKKSA